MKRKTPLAHIAATTCRFPPYYHPQKELTDELREIWSDSGMDVNVFDRFNRTVTVKARHLAKPKPFYRQISNFRESNKAWIEVALDLGERNLADLLRESGLEPGEIHHLLTTTVTGIAVPSLDALLMNRVSFSPRLKRVPLFGLGCVAGAAGLARLADFLKGDPEGAGIILSVELCTLTLQRDDLSVANMIASQLFGDGSASILLVGDDHPLAERSKGRILDSRSVFFPNTEEVMGWEITGNGFKVLLQPGVATYARDHLRPAVESFLADNDLTLRDVHHWLAHPGGPRVMEAMQEGLELNSGALRLSWDCLRDNGNLSSSSVLVILDTFLKEIHPEPGTYGLMTAFGPGFCAELVLIQW